MATFFDEFLRQKQKKFLWFNLGFWFGSRVAWAWAWAWAWSWSWSWIGWVDLAHPIVGFLDELRWTCLIVDSWACSIIILSIIYKMYRSTCAYCTCLSSTNLKNLEENNLKLLKSLINLKLKVEELDLLLWSLNVSTSFWSFLLLFWILKSLKIFKMNWMKTPSVYRGEGSVKWTS